MVNSVKMRSKLTIITVTFNCRENLKNSIESIHSQSFKDWEHIIIDGASTDGTIEIIEQNLNAIAYWISEKDNGIYDAMNKGLKAATGDYVIFLNAGDTFYDQHTLSKIPFDKFPRADIFYGETMIIDAVGKHLGLRRKKLPHNLTWKHFKSGMVVCHQSILVKKQIAPFYDLNYKYTADIDWVIKSLKASNQTVYTQTIISNFIEGGFSNQNLLKSWIDRFIILKVYFGLFQTIRSHLSFIMEKLLVKLSIVPSYRKIKL